MNKINTLCSKDKDITLLTSKLKKFFEENKELFSFNLTETPKNPYGEGYSKTIENYIKNWKKKVKDFDFFIILSHWNSDCIYWSNKNEILIDIEDNENCNLFEWKNIILISCDSNNKLSKKLKYKTCISFWKVNTDLIEIDKNWKEKKLNLPQRKHVIKKLQELFASIIINSLKKSINFKNWYIDMIRLYNSIRFFTFKAIYNPNCNIKMKKECKNFIRLQLLDFVDWIKIS